MGMGYQYAGSASYPRFDRELCAVAKIFGGEETKHLKERKETENCRPLGYWFGFYSSDDSGEKKFSFPEGVDKLLAEWFNNIYEEFDPSQTKKIWEHISEHDEIENISYQIWNELKNCVENGTSWFIT